VQRLKVWDHPQQEWVDCKPLLVAGALWSGQPPTFAVAAGDWAEAFWLAGPAALRQFQSTLPATAPARSILFAEGGWAVLRDEARYALLEFGPVGQSGVGGHAHNDALSLEVFADGQAWIVDPGAYVYSADYELRRDLRRTRAHNTVYVPGREQNPLAPHSLFRVEESGPTRLLHWATTEAYTLVVAEVQFAGVPALTHRRTVLYAAAERAWLVVDHLHPYHVDARLHWTFAPGVHVELVTAPGTGLRLSNAAGQSLVLWSEAGGPATITPAWVSAGYGTREPSQQAELAFRGAPAHAWALLPGATPTDAPARYQALRRVWVALPAEVQELLAA
jgi:hypothetical protein